jgi:hypothetical protein
VHFENNIFFIYFVKTLKPTHYNAGVVVVNSEVEGLTPGHPEPNQPFFAC